MESNALVAPALCHQPFSPDRHAALGLQVDREIKRLSLKLRQIMKVPKEQQVTGPGEGRGGRTSARGCGVLSCVSPSPGPAL